MRIQIKMAAEGDFCVGATVWYRSDKDTGWWPCVVTGVREGDEEGGSAVRLQSLGDGYEYGYVRVGLSEMHNFTCAKCRELVEEQLTRLGKKRHKTLLRAFVAAIKEALGRNPSFQLNLELPDIGTLPTTPKNPPVREVWPNLNDPNTFTFGSSSSADGTPRSSRRRLLRSGGVPKSPMECHIVPPCTTDSAKSDILVDRSRTRRKKSRKSGGGESVSERKKRRKEKSEEESTRLTIPKLDLDQSGDDTVTSDILSTCHTLTCPVPTTGRKNESAGIVASQQGTSGEKNPAVSVRGGGVREKQSAGGWSDKEVNEKTSSHSPMSRTAHKENGVEGIVEGRRKDGVEGGVVVGGGKEEGEGEAGGGSDSSATNDDEDDLPSYPTNTSTEIVVNNLKEGDLIWSKYQTFPHWPGLVVKVCPSKKKANATAKIVYFGDNMEYRPEIVSRCARVLCAPPCVHCSVTVRHRRRQNLARFVLGIPQFDDFMRAGRECGVHSEFFLRSVKEAESFITAKCSKELTGSAIEMFKQICERRPASLAPCVSWMDMTLNVQQNEDAEAPAVSAFGYRLDSELMDTGAESDVSDSETESKEEEEDPMYSLDKVLDYITELKPILRGIMSDSVSSDYHQLFTRGTAREKYQLGNCNKFGPCRKWKTDKQVVLIRHIEEIAKEAVSESGSQFTYARDVLLPEAMIRTISHFEGISEQKAREKL